MDCRSVLPIIEFGSNGMGRYKPRCLRCDARKNYVYRRASHEAKIRAASEWCSCGLCPECVKRGDVPRVDPYRIACVACGYEVFDAMTEARMRLLAVACVRCGRCRGPVEFEIVTEWVIRTSMLAAHSITHTPSMAHAWRESMA